MINLQEEVLSHFNEPVLCMFELGRCIGYGEDESDCYLIIQHPRGVRKGQVIWHTCVGGYTYLNLLKEQGKITSTTGEYWNDFTRLDNMLELNGAEKQSAPIIDLRIERKNFWFGYGRPDV